MSERTIHTVSCANAQRLTAYTVALFALCVNAVPERTSLRTRHAQNTAFSLTAPNDHALWLSSRRNGDVCNCNSDHMCL